MSDLKRFDSSNIYENIIHSQIIYNSGYVNGIKETKQKTIARIKESMHRAELMVDSNLYKELLYLLQDIEKI